MSEPRFGELPQVPQVPVVEFQPGDAVEIVGGRYRGSKAVVVSVDRIPTPSGREVVAVRFRRPRAGESWELPSMLRLEGKGKQ